MIIGHAKSMAIKQTLEHDGAWVKRRGVGYSRIYSHRSSMLEILWDHPKQTFMDNCHL